MLRIVLLTLFVACASASAIKGEEIKVDEIKDLNDFSIVAPDGSTFRFDYTYHGLAAGWLKLHRTTASWTIARLACRLEGARLASPIDPSLYSTMTEMLQQSTLQSVFTGINALSISSDFTSVEGVHISQMPLVWKSLPAQSTNESRLCLAMTREGEVYQTSCEKEQPFFCYKARDRASEMNFCGTTDPGYVRSFETGSCYKVHRNLANWFQAQTTCAAEGGHLVIINNDREAQIVSDMARGTSEYLSVGLVNWYQYDRFDLLAWRTVDGQTLEEAGYANWQPGEPNNEGDEYCGSITWVWDQVGFNDISCETESAFICEITRPRVPVWW